MDTSTKELNWTTRWNLELEPKFHQYWFEKVDVDYWYNFSEVYMNSVLTLIVIFYLAGVWHLSMYMRNKQPLSLRVPLFCWNLFVGIFSSFVFYRIGCELFLYAKMPHGFYRSICIREGLHMSTFFWTVVFNWSKMFFMLDTLFLILRKKPMSVMHLLHHIIAIIYTPNSSSFGEPVTRWFALANLFVHAVDYPILALNSLKIHLPMTRQLMAGLEVAQLVFILFLSGYTIILNKTGSYCVRHPKSVLITYSALLVLLVVLVGTLLSPEYWKKRGDKLKRN